jgi:hypothetical protein
MDFAERAAHNEEIFREVNQRIEAGAARHQIEAPLPFHCECADTACFEKIEIPRSEYDRIASHIARFIVVPGHERDEVERVVERHDTFFVVEKVGEAREHLKQNHPRTRHR